MGQKSSKIVGTFILLSSKHSPKTLFLENLCLQLNCLCPTLFTILKFEQILQCSDHCFKNWIEIAIIFCFNRCTKSKGKVGKRRNFTLAQKWWGLISAFSVLSSTLNKFREIIILFTWFIREKVNWFDGNFVIKSSECVDKREILTHKKTFCETTLY